MSHRLDVVVVEGASPSGLAIAVDLLDGANHLRPADPPFVVTVRSPSGGRVALRGGTSVDTTSLAEGRQPDAAIAVGLGSGGPGEIVERLARPDARATSRWLAGLHAQGRHVLGACTATFLLGEAGLLDGTRCTTTWWLATTLAERYPAATVAPDEIVVRDGRVWTAGASLAQTDLVLAYVEHHLGARRADELAHRLAHPRRRTQRPHRVAVPTTDDPAVQAVENHVAAHVASPITLADLAAAARMSPRTLARRTVAATGLSPVRLVQRLRLDEALRIIEREDAGLDVVARRVGLADAATLYGLAKRTLGRAPSSFRPTTPRRTRRAR